MLSARLYRSLIKSTMVSIILLVCSPITLSAFCCMTRPQAIITKQKQSTLSIKTSFWQADQQTHCSICLVKLTYKKLARVLCEPCQHIFHYDCLKPWIKKHTICPLCTQSIEKVTIEINMNNQ